MHFYLVFLFLSEVTNKKYISVRTRSIALSDSRCFGKKRVLEVDYLLCVAVLQLLTLHMAQPDEYLNTPHSEVGRAIQ